jgi:DNA polymerase IV
VTDPRRIAHLDMDAYYASVELLRRPELRGLPLVIGGRRGLERLAGYSGRGVITTATYEARAFGLRSGMSLTRAAALCPRAVLLPADFDEYRRVSRLFKEAVARVAPRIEDRGIDEIYIDLSAAEVDVRDAARAVKAAVREATGLSCSIGVAPNKLLAKIASELDKPDGLTVLGPDDLAARVWPLPATRINGVGPKAGGKLAALGIRSVGELAAADRALLVLHFGPGYGAWLHDAAHGRDERALVTEREPKSISRETTFERDLHPRLDRDALSAIFTRLCEKLAEDLRRKGYRGRSVGIKLRYDNFRTLTRDRTLESHTDDARAIRRAAGECLKRAPLERRLRLLGVRVGSLVPAGEAIDLFG